MTNEAFSFQPTPIITFGYIMQLLFGLLVIFGMLYVTAKFFLPKLKLARSGQIIKIVERIYLEPQVSACLISIGKQNWLIGIGNKQITKIDKINQEDLA